MQNISKVFRLPAVILGIFLAGFYSCQKEEVVVKDSGSSTKEEVRVENGYLVFADEAYMNKTLASLNNLSGVELDKWENALGFVSKRTKINEALTAFGKAATKEEADAAKERYNDLLLFNNEGDFVRPSFPLSQRAALVNAAGLVKVGRDLLVFKDDRVITIKNGSLLKLEEAEKLPSSDETVGIYINKIYTSSFTPEDKNARVNNGPYLVPLCSKLYPCGGPVQPRLYRTEINYSYYETGPAPVAGYTQANYEVKCDLTSVWLLCKGQAGYNANLNLLVRNAIFEYPSTDSNVGAVYQTFPNTETARYGYYITMPMFTGSVFIRYGDTFHGKVTIGHRSTVNGEVYCDQYSQVVTW